jgi:LDH2 family malate/lactate/ureidoglycolate dehydrogenase
MVRLSAAEAKDFATEVLAGLGTPDDIAAAVAGWLVSSDLSGHPSHGIIRLTDYARRIERGTLDASGRASVRWRHGAVVVVDAARGFGHIAAALLTDELCDLVPEHGVAAGAVVNVSHTGRLGEWAESAARRNVILFLCYASLDKSNVAAFGAREARLGTNPLTFGVPAAGGDSLIVDFATSALAGGKMQHHIESGEPAPPGALIDRDGRPTTDPSAFVDGGMLLPFGGHKGYGLSLLVSVLAGCVAGQAAEDRDHGVFAVALDPGCFAPRDGVLEATRAQLERMRTTPPAPGVASVLVPGDFERANRTSAGGVIDVPTPVWANLTALADSLATRPRAAG